MPTLRPMTIDDFDPVTALWSRTEGVGLNESDSRPAIAAYLIRNPGLSLVVEESAAIIGAVLCGHDGRRGYLHHLAVDKPHRGRGLGKTLVEACLQRLQAAGITRCNLYLFADHDAGESFWTHHGWAARTDLKVLQKRLDGRDLSEQRA